MTVCVYPAFVSSCKAAVIEMKLRNAKMVMTLTLLIFFSVLGWAQNNAPKARPFTVQDSIEISYFIGGTQETNIVGRGTYPPGGSIMAPDQKHFLLITQRGVLATNRLEAALWVLDRRSVWDYLSKRTSAKPTVRQIAKLSAQSNTPVISSVRWLEDSKRVAFLGKSDSGCQHLFIANISTDSVARITAASLYVTAYDIRGETVAYTTLEPKHVTDEEQVINVTGHSLYSLLFPNSPRRLEELDETILRTMPSVLHVRRHGKEIPIRFRFNGKPLRLIMPTLALSPDETRLVTVAPASIVLPSWELFQPAVKAAFLYLKSHNKATVSDDNPFKASQYIIVNLHDGSASAIMDAPAGRGLGYYGAPTKGVWFSDSNRVILSNTFLPLNGVQGEEEKAQRAKAPSVAVLDCARQSVQPITYLTQPPSPSDIVEVIREVLVDDRRHNVSFDYGNFSGDDPAIRFRDTYTQEKGVWLKTSQRNMGESTSGIELSIKQALDQPPVLFGSLGGDRNGSIIWDPNPQLGSVSMGKTSVYRWLDKNGRECSGVLALPPNYDPKVRYPLVIQTYGYKANKFFSDGAYTTGYGGRALVAKDIVVLQADEARAHMGTSEEGPDQVAVFESAINQLSATGLVDAHRVGIIGFSRTCFHVLYSMTNRPHLFAAASITDGLNFGYLQYVLSSDYLNYQQLFEDVNGGIPFGNGLKAWASSAPGFNLEKIKTPLLISALEKGELIGEWETYSGLRRLNKAVDMWWLRKENAPHILTQPAQRRASQQMAIDWFAFWLKGEEDSDTNKATQYSTWRKLRKLSEDHQTTADRTSD